MQFLKTFDTRGILSTPASDIHDRLKSGTAIKIARATTNNQQKKCNQFGETFTETTMFIHQDKY